MNNLKKLTENSYISSTDLTENISKFLFKNAKNFNNGSPININITENNFLSVNGKKYYAEDIELIESSLESLNSKVDHILKLYNSNKEDFNSLRIVLNKMDKS